jgi:hypothetical protein
MTALASVLRDDSLMAALEADFMQYFGLDIYDIWQGRLSLHRAARLMARLPKDCRLYKLVIKDPLSYQDHLLMSILDAARTGAYFSMAAARGAITDKGAWKKIAANAPQALPRPGDEDKSKRKAIVVHDPKNALEAVSRLLNARAMSKAFGR